MPITTCSRDGKSGHKWGEKGKCYTGSGSRKKAQAQASAAYASGYDKTDEGKKLPKKKSKANEAKQTLIDIIKEELKAYIREQRNGK